MSDLNTDYFEKVLCYKALFDSTYLTTIVDHVKPTYFKDKNIASVFNIISEFSDRRGKLPTLTEVKTYLTTEELRNSFKQLVNSFSDIDKNIDKEELYENTERFLKEKAVYVTMLEMASDLSKGSIDTAKMLDKFEKSCNINLVTDLGFNLHRDIEILIDDLTNVQKSIPSTWEWLDTALNGGFMENGRALYVFAGETNIGKSIFLGNIAANIANQGKNVLLITLEMSELLYAKRICSNVSKIPLKDLSFNTHALRQAVRERESQGKGQLFIKEFPPSTITPNQLKAFIKKITDQGIKIDTVVVDYLNLIHSPIGTNSYERVKNVTEQVRAMSYVFNCPFISATQLNRCLDIDTEIITTEGVKTLGNIKAGDQISGKGSFVTVRYVYPREIQKCYKITTKSGKEIICSSKHLFPTKNGIQSISSGLNIGNQLMVKKLT